MNDATKKTADDLYEKIIRDAFERLSNEYIFAVTAYPKTHFEQVSCLRAAANCLELAKQYPISALEDRIRGTLLMNKIENAIFEPLGVV